MGLGKQVGVADGIRPRDNFTMKARWLTMARMSLAAAVLVFGLVGSAIAAAVGEAERAFEQGRHALERGNFDAAIAQFDEAVRRDPKQAKFQGMRGVAWIRKGEYAKGAADLKAAVELTPGDAGSDYPPAATKPPSDEALRHGRRQVALMLKDRPAMADFPEQAGVLRDWAARKFAGEDFGALIDWDPSPPLDSDAEHLAPDGADHAMILVQADYDEGAHAGEPRSFEELWAGAIYELHNVVYAREFVRLNNEANQGKVSKEAFVLGILKYELRAAQQTRAFYLQVFVPWAEKNRQATDPSLWFCNWWDTPDTVLNGFTDKAAYPWKPYARTHDWATVHRQWRYSKFQRALRLLEQMRDEEGYDEDQAEVQFWIGRCLARLNKSAEAVAAFSEAIRYDPDKVAAYQSRGRIYQKLGEEAKAKADFAKVKELKGRE
jgi:Flp pilus assembly protein TadD